MARSEPGGRIRVLRVIARMNVGGPALQVAGLAEGLDRERFDQRLLVGQVSEGEANYLELRSADVEAVEVRGLGRAPRPWDDVVALGRLVGEVRTFRPHIVHTHTAKAGALGRLAAVLGRAPARVHHFHGHLLHGYFSPMVTWGVVRTERVLARVTDRLVTVGSQVRDELLDAGIGRAEQYVALPPGVSLPDAPTREEARRVLDLPADAPVVAFVARLTRVKRPDRFIDVAQCVLEQIPMTVFLVTGEGDLLEETRRKAAPLAPQVRFLGWRGDVETVYAAADVVVLTSDNEGMPVSLIEAAMAGCPAVTTRVGSAAEVVLDGVTGYVRDHDAPSLADAAVAILRDKDLRQRLASAASEDATLRFGRDRLITDIAELYESLAREKGFG